MRAQVQTQALFRRAVKESGAGIAPRDEHALEVCNVGSSTLSLTYLQTLTAFLGAVLSKKYTNPSSDAIEVLAGLDNVDKLITELVTSLDGVIRAGPQCQSPVMLL